jgi:hypothetical protein
MLSNCHLVVYSYFRDKKNLESFSTIDNLETVKRSSELEKKKKK